MSHARSWIPLARALSRPQQRCDLRARGKIDLSEAFIDGSFVGAKKGGRSDGKSKRGKGTEIMAVADRAGLPVAIGIASALPHEVRLVEKTLDNAFLSQPPEYVLGDKAYDSAELDQRMRRERGIELVAPHRSNR